MKLFAVACLAAAALADQCSDTTCTFVDISVPAAIQSEFAHNFGTTTKIMKITHNNDEHHCHTANQTQESDGTWGRTHDCTGTHCYKGLHCGLTDKNDWTSCKCYKESDNASKAGDMAHTVATQFPQAVDSPTDTNLNHDLATDTATYTALAGNHDDMEQTSGAVVAEAHDPVPHFNGNTGAHTGGSTDHNPAQ